MYNNQSSPTLNEVDFEGNQAFGSAWAAGGGMFNTEANPTLTEVTFSDNSATGYSAYGGGISNYVNASPTLTDVTFSVAAGEIFGILGPNGAGKTTTVERLQGLRQADGGEIQVKILAVPGTG